MAIRTVFTNDAATDSLDELELFADNEGFITIMMQDPNDSMCFTKVQLDKESALLLSELLITQIALL